jgi:hypothetical protein
VFGQRLPVESNATQRPENSSSCAAERRIGLGARELVSDWMSIFQPVSRAARRAFRPSLPIASASWSSGTTTVASRVVVDEHLAHARGRERLGDEARRLRVPRDDVDLLAAELGDDHADARAARADAGADGSTPCAWDSTAIFER